MSHGREQRGRGTSGQRPDEGIARNLSDLARELQAEHSTETLLSRVASGALNEIDAAEYAGISQIERHNVRTHGASDPLVAKIDTIQYRLRSGPCLSSLRQERTVRSDDLALDDRWPGFTDAAVDLGIRSMLSVQLYVESDNLGALNLYSTQLKAFDDRDESTAMLLAAHAAIAIRGSQRETDLRAALDSRDVIGQAKGILMERFKIDQARALELLVLASQRSHRKLREVAEDLAQTGDLGPAEPTRPASRQALEGDRRTRRSRGESNARS